MILSTISIKIWSTIKLSHSNWNYSFFYRVDLPVPSSFLRRCNFQATKIWHPKWSQYQFKDTFIIATKLVLIIFPLKYNKIWKLAHAQNTFLRLTCIMKSIEGLSVDSNIIFCLAWYQSYRMKSIHTMKKFRIPYF